MPRSRTKQATEREEFVSTSISSPPYIHSWHVTLDGSRHVMEASKWKVSTSYKQMSYAHFTQTPTSFHSIPPIRRQGASNSSSATFQAEPEPPRTPFTPRQPPRPAEIPPPPQPKYRSQNRQGSQSREPPRSEEFPKRPQHSQRAEGPPPRQRRNRSRIKVTEYVSYIGPPFNNNLHEYSSIRNHIC